MRRDNSAAKEIHACLVGHKVETFSPGYQDTPNCNALHKRETSDEMIRTLPYFSSLSRCFSSARLAVFYPLAARLERRA